MNVSKVFRILILLFLCSLIYVAQKCPAQQYYQAGDINYDGWCNWADFNILEGYFAGNCDTDDFCMEGADFNGNGQVNGLDVNYLLQFLNGTGAPPVGFCPDVSRTCDISEQARIWLVPIADENPDQSTFSVYVEATADIGALNFSFEYDSQDIAAFSTDNPSDIITVSFNQRPFIEIIGFLVLCEDHGNGHAYPTGIGGTRIFDIVIDRQPDAPDAMLSIVEDPIYGPPHFYFGAPGNCAGEDIICPSVAYMVTGDVNGSDSYNGLDITYGVNYFKGIVGLPVGKYFYNVPVQWDF